MSGLLLRYCENEFSDSIVNINVDFKQVPYRWEGMEVKLCIWDTAGQERYRTMWVAKAYQTLICQEF